MEIIRIKDITKEDFSLVGGKGVNLGRLINIGLNVPEGFCITSKAYDRFLRTNKLEESISSCLNRYNVKEISSTECSDKIQKLIRGGTMEKKLVAIIIEQYQKLGDNVRVAVRSSATAEDLPEASFAGQQETYLNVCHNEQVIKQVIECWSSLWSPRAMEYRNQSNLLIDHLSIAVIVQRMVDSEISGVLFTRNPINRKKEMMINSAYGLGEMIVSGKVNPDLYLIDYDTDNVISKIIATKEIKMEYDRNKGNVVIPVPHNLQESSSLQQQHIKSIVELGKIAEKHFGCPQDIEWSILNNKVYILQARPITTLLRETETENIVSDVNNLAAEYSSLDQKELLNMLEHFPTPLYPIDFYPYNNIMNQRIALFEGMGIKSNPTMTMSSDGVITLNKATMRLNVKVFGIGVHLKKFLMHEKNIQLSKLWYKIYEDKINNANDVDKSDMTDEQLVNSIESLVSISGSIASIRWKYNIFPQVIESGLLKKKLQFWGLKIDEHDIYSGLRYMTWEMNIRLKEIVRLISEDRILYEALQNTNASNPKEVQKLQNLFLSEHSAIRGEIMEFLSEYGWKSSMSYYAFSSFDWKSNWMVFVSLLKVFIISNKYEETKLEHNNVIALVQSKFGSSKRSKKLVDSINFIRNYHILREKSLYLIEMAFGISRSFYRELKQRHVDFFRDEEDWLYLLMNELNELLNSGPHSFLERVELRKKNYLKNSVLWISVNKADSNTTQLQGVIGNSGFATGIVRIVDGVDDFNTLHKGEVLVCKFTDPVWTPLFSVACAVVSDTGGPLSHSAIVAREYGIPAVLGTGKATTVLKTGEKVMVDGNKGIVTLL